MEFDPIKLLMIPVFLLSITIHEFSHALLAKKAGDNTATMLGRLSLNPIAHIDVVGTIILPLISLFSGLPTIGWAKPVPVNPRNYKQPYWDIFVSLAGPASNMILAFLAVLFIKLGLLFFTPNVMLEEILSPGFANRGVQGVYYILLFLLYINILLTMFNLLPIPPLDGSHVLFYKIAPGGMKEQIFVFLRQYGFFMIIIFFVMMKSTSRIFGELIYYLASQMMKLFAIQ